MSRLGFYFNQAKCIGCRACQIACKDVNDLDVGVLYRGVKTFETGAYPTPGLYHYSATCNHCEKPACVVNCPTGAMAKADDGTVQHDDELCIGCKTCMESCPYDVPQYLSSEKICNKCDSCAGLRAEGLNPACVDACNMRVLEFGDLDELEAKYAEQELIIDFPFLPDSSETVPSTRVYARPCALKADFVMKAEV